MLFRFTRSSIPSLLVHAPGKLNLHLEILGKRSDGFHELETLMVSLDLYDSLEFQDDASGQIRLFTRDVGQRCGASDPDQQLPHDDANLVVRAAHVLRAYTGVDRGVRMRLFKRIPVAAGLGGGSSDAAATLVALNRLWKLDLSLVELRRLAAQLGSDIPFFIGTHSAAVCRGRGESIEPLRGPGNWPFVVVRPVGGLSTAEVFSRFRTGARPRSLDGLVNSLAVGRKRAAARHFYNALQGPARQLHPGVDALRSAFSEQPVLGHMMTGSGSA
ncbi:MAG: 4-(cytidine 5'-diphospho)-2-C-methyl-D-erythritol kinase, partial [Planctomycetaceae bacterium]